MISSLSSHLLKAEVKFYPAVIGNKKFNETPLAILVLFMWSQFLINIDVQSIRQGSGLSTSTAMCDLHPIPDLILYWLPLSARDIYLPQSLLHFVPPVHRNDCSWNLSGISCSPWFPCSFLPQGQDRKWDFAEYFECGVGDLRKKWGSNGIHCCICRCASVCSIVLLFIGSYFFWAQWEPDSR